MYLKLAGLAVVLASLFGAYTWVRHDAVTEYKTEQAVLQAKADKITQEKYNTLAADYETLKASRTTQFKTIVRTVEKLVDRPVYKVACIDTDGLEVANKALRGGHE